MNLKRRDLGVDGVFDENGSNAKVLQVKAKHFNRLRFTLVIAFSLAAGLTYSVKRLYDNGVAQAEENYRLSTQVVALRSQLDAGTTRLEALTAATDSSNTKALSYIDGIQGKLKKINDYLGRRGLKSVSFRGVTASISANPSKKASNIQLYAKYNRYLELLVNNVAMVPMGYPRISSFTSFFGYRGNPFDFGRNEFHPGLDFRGQVGDPVKCTASGRIVFTGRAGGYGNCVRIQHANGVQTWYGHLSRISVHEGQSVTVGEVIGKVGSTGRSTGPHLHYEVRRNGRAVNPQQYLTLSE
ncbi:M23 family metallopeptidase [Mucilaginibacter ginkgonis]|uniref:M23 family metallopeptidase n=1 Tax=Mucilaginibacter ginkgonis TaxID=2682091 RepID=A0A7T7JGL8_9SPHI|nr:M23 family metallopeptidase [Mucilaginibacter ginkgonis]QQL49314.1 M23 family metallopeptidase [Mucilaginibacter ginkgonis]